MRAPASRMAGQDVYWFQTRTPARIGVAWSVVGSVMSLRYASRRARLPRPLDGPLDARELGGLILDIRSPHVRAGDVAVRARERRVHRGVAQAAPARNGQLAAVRGDVHEAHLRVALAPIATLGLPAAAEEDDL